MAKHPQPHKSMTAKAESSAFVKPFLRRGLSVLGVSGLVMGMGVAVTSSASAATPPFACTNANTAVAGATPEADGGDLAEIQATLDGVEPEGGVKQVCLDGTFVRGADSIADTILLDEDAHFFGTETTSIDGIRFASPFDDLGGEFLHSITIEKLSITNSEGSAIQARDVTVIDSTFSNNEGVLGGAIAGYGTVDITESTFIGNSSASGGGAIVAYGLVNVSDSTFMDNSSPMGTGGAIIGTSVAVNNSTFDSNTAGNGGAIYVPYEPPSEVDPGLPGEVLISNSTFVSNSASDEGGAIFASAGYVYFSTFVNNLAAAPDVDDPNADTPGNAIYRTGTSTFALAANIFAGSSIFPQLGYGRAPSAYFDDFGGNVFSTSSGTETDINQDASTKFEADLTELFGTLTPSLATHAPNTFGTQAIGLVSGSPAVDVVPFDVTDNVGPLLDQRGAPRTHPADAGSFEGVVATTSPPAVPASQAAPAALAKTGSESSLWLTIASAILVGFGGLALGLRSRLRLRNS